MQIVGSMLETIFLSVETIYVYLKEVKLRTYMKQ